MRSRRRLLLFPKMTGADVRRAPRQNALLGRLRLLQPDVRLARCTIPRSRRDCRGDGPPTPSQFALHLNLFSALMSFGLGLSTRCRYHIHHQLARRGRVPWPTVAGLTLEWAGVLAATESSTRRVRRRRRSYVRVPRSVHASAAGAGARYCRRSGSSIARAAAQRIDERADADKEILVVANSRSRRQRLLEGPCARRAEFRRCPLRCRAYRASRRRASVISTRPWRIGAGARRPGRSRRRRPRDRVHRRSRRRVPFAATMDCRRERPPRRDHSSRLPPSKQSGLCCAGTCIERYRERS